MAVPCAGQQDGEVLPILIDIGQQGHVLAARVVDCSPLSVCQQRSIGIDDHFLGYRT